MWPMVGEAWARLWDPCPRGIDGALLGGRLTPDTRIGLIVRAHVLVIDRVVLLVHTKCAVTSSDDMIQ